VAHGENTGPTNGMQSEKVWGLLVEDQGVWSRCSVNFLVEGFSV